MTDPVKILNVGSGWVVQNRHVPALRKSGRFTLMGIVSPSPGHATDAARRCGLPHASDHLDFSSGWMAEADAVMLGCAPQAHFGIAEQALLAGKHVLADKPLAVSREEAQQLEELAVEKGKVLALVHNVQYGRAGSRLFHHLQRGDLGSIRAVYGTHIASPGRSLPNWVSKLPMGRFFVEAPHFYYLFDRLAEGELTLRQGSIWASPENPDRPRLVTAAYQDSGGVPFLLHMNFESSTTEWHLTIVTDRGTVDIDAWRDIYLFVPADGTGAAAAMIRKTSCAVGQHVWGCVTGGVRMLLGRQLFGNVEIVSRFADAIAGKGRLTGMSAADGRAVVERQHELIENAERF